MGYESKPEEEPIVTEEPKNEKEELFGLSEEELDELDKKDPERWWDY